MDFQSVANCIIIASTVMVGCLIVRTRQSRCVVTNAGLHNAGALLEVLLKFSKHWLRFQLERLLVRGLSYRLLIVAIIIVSLSTIAGVVVFALTRAFTMPEAIWWAFLRLTDPGYLGDDEGVAKATISTAITLLGYIFFTGALIAILTTAMGLGNRIGGISRKRGERLPGNTAFARKPAIRI